MARYPQRREQPQPPLSFAEEVRELRFTRGLSRKALGALIHYSPSYIRDVEEGKPPSNRFREAIEAQKLR